MNQFSDDLVIDVLASNSRTDSRTFESKTDSQSPESMEYSEISHSQQWMLEALIFPGKVNREQMENRFISGANLNATECFAIYQRSYILRLSKCLAEQFPALTHALGEQLFDQFARQYLMDRPSMSYTLYELGRRFPSYLEQIRPDHDLPPVQREGWIDFMVDLANYEYLHFSLFDAPGHEGNPWPEIDVLDKSLVLQPCFELGLYRYPVAWYYHSFAQHQVINFPPQQTSYVAVLRKDYLTTTFPINRIHFLFLKQLQSCGDIASSLKYVSETTHIALEQVRNSWTHEVRDSWIKSGFFIAQ